MSLKCKDSGVRICLESLIRRDKQEMLTVYKRFQARCFHKLTTSSSPHRSLFHPRAPHPGQRREERRQAVLLLPGEVLRDGPDSCDPVAHRTHLPGVYTAQGVFVLWRKHNEKKACVDMKNRPETPEASRPLCLNVYGRRISVWPTLMCWNPHVSLTFLSTMHPSVCEIAP